MRERSDVLQQKYESIWFDYYEEGADRPALCKKYNMTIAGMNKVIAFGKQTYPDRVRNPSRKVDPRRTENRRPLSPVHLTIGLRVTRYMREHKLNCTEFGVRVNLTRVRVSELQSGYYDPRITDLNAIAAVLEIPVFELMSPPPKIVREHVR